jgi:metacaspase-1
MISDSCHSGSVARMSLMMPNMEKKPAPNRKVRFLNPSYFLKKDSALQAARRVENIRARSRIRDATVLFAGCRDDEYSYDGDFDGRCNGVFSYVALHTLRSLPADADYGTWYRNIKKYLPNVEYPQSPQLSGSSAQKKWKVLAE